MASVVGLSVSPCAAPDTRGTVKCVQVGGTCPEGVEFRPRLGGAGLCDGLHRRRVGSAPRVSKGRKYGPISVAASVEENMKETSTSSEVVPEADAPSTSSGSSPFRSSGKISSIAAKRPSPSEPGVAGIKDGATEADKKPSPSFSVGSKQPRPAGQLSAKAAEQLKVSKPPASKPVSPFTASGGPQEQGSKPRSPFVQPSRGQRVVDAFRDGEKSGRTTKFGQPVVPSNIFQDERRTPEQEAAEAFKFSVSPGQLLLVGSFTLIAALMAATAFVVWKLGGIHYNEY